MNIDVHLPSFHDRERCPLNLVCVAFYSTPSVRVVSHFCRICDLLFWASQLECLLLSQEALKDSSLFPAALERIDPHWWANTAFDFEVESSGRNEYHD